MAHEIESMFYTRTTPWHGLGIRVEEALSSSEALTISGLDWQVVQQPIYTEGQLIPNYKANVRDKDDAILAKLPEKYIINGEKIEKKNIKQVRDDILLRYFEAPDLKVLPKNAYRFVNAISDHSTHSMPIRQTASYNENLFMRTMDGGLNLLDKAHQLVRAAA